MNEDVWVDPILLMSVMPVVVMTIFNPRKQKLLRHGRVVPAFAIRRYENKTKAACIGDRGLDSTLRICISPFYLGEIRILETL
jgi:hypothetical protein